MQVYALAHVLRDFEKPYQQQINKFKRNLA